MKDVNRKVILKKIDGAIAYFSDIHRNISPGFYNPFKINNKPVAVVRHTTCSSHVKDEDHWYYSMLLN